jgi:hypothetical protein
VDVNYLVSTPIFLSQSNFNLIIVSFLPHLCIYLGQGSRLLQKLKTRILPPLVKKSYFKNTKLEKEPFSDDFDNFYFCITFLLVRHVAVDP